MIHEQFTTRELLPKVCIQWPGRHYSEEPVLGSISGPVTRGAKVGASYSHILETGSASIIGNVTFPAHKAVNHVHFLNTFSCCGIFFHIPNSDHTRLTNGFQASACIIGPEAAGGEGQPQNVPRPVRVWMIFRRWLVSQHYLLLPHSVVKV